ncbi:MAG: hypothetical protein ACE5JD_08945 [Candidatus Methylomirabilia bacterium]
MSSADRELYAREALRYFPKLLGLVDRNPLSPTYGCFDRNYWHYKATDFPSGMAETGVLPLALAHTHPFPGADRYHQQPRLAELVVAGIRFAARSAHRDGSCDDYYPFERALGATAFSLYALTESCLLLGLQDPDLLAFLERRGRWLLSHDEAGRLSNHQALGALALYNVSLLTGEQEFQAGSAKRIDRLLGWQSSEGWFWEYEGADPGYQTATIDFLAKCLSKSRDERLLEPLRHAVSFCQYFVHPDGSYGGAYGSRNTFHFFPAGFELLADRIPEAAAIASVFLEGLRHGKQAYAEDDRIFFHWVWDYLQAFLSCQRRALPPAGFRNRTRHFPEARLYVREEPTRYAISSLAKGGVLALFEHGRRMYSDHGLIGELEDGRVVLTQLVDQYEAHVGEEEISVEGTFGYASGWRPSPWRMLLFRLALLTVGRFASDLLRRLLQRLLIVGKREAPLHFRRTVRFGAEVTLIDEVWLPPKARARGLRLRSLYAGTDHTAIYTATSRVFQESCLQPWNDYAPHLPALRSTGSLRVERRLGGVDQIDR